MGRFLLKPKWIVFHLLVIGLVVLMVNLAFWQLRRLDERQARNAAVEAAQQEAGVPVGSLVASDDATAVGESVEWRAVTATGTYDVAQQVLIRNRSFDGVPGDHVVTPLRFADGTAVLVNRGWIPLAGGGDRPAEAPDPTEGTVTVTGRVRASQERGRFGPRDPADGALTVLSRVDVERLEKQVPYPLLPVYVELVSQQPPSAGDLPRPLPPPEQSEGPHLAYAGQWFLFAIVTVVGWAVVVRRTAKKRAQDEALFSRVTERPPEPMRGVRMVPRTPDTPTEDPAPADATPNTPTEDLAPADDRLDTTTEGPTPADATLGDRPGPG